MSTKNKGRQTNLLFDFLHSSFLYQRPLDTRLPEDLLFFFDHFGKVGGVVDVEQSLLLYCYHQHTTTHSVLEATIWPCCSHFLVLTHWVIFTIGNWGQAGVQAGLQRKVGLFCDIDENKLTGLYC
eukprot:XP_011535838.1 UDP-GlcNAc:betaGal beta-1,3-N-acetylglucosaminyltransferase-like protein 1 [Homo sapiens]